MSRAERAGLFGLAREHVTIGGLGGANAGVKMGAWSRGWPPGRTASMTWAYCGTA
jgi:hypothetical protein